MTRPDLMKALIAIYGTRQAAADAIGVSRSTVGLIERGHRSLTDDVANRMISALCDRAGQADKLAEAIDAQVKAHPMRSRKGKGARDERGMFV
jgi:DNA-binding XRE family transcriptional regulator